MAESGSLSSILNSNGTGLSPSKSVRSNDRVFKYASDGGEAGDGIDRQTEQVLRSIETVEDHYRHDTVRDINWSMTILANSIKVVSAVLTILSVDQTDRSDDDYDEAIGTLLSIGASVLKVAGEKILEYYNNSDNSETSSVSKIGEPAPAPSTDPAEDLIRKSQVSDLVSQLSPQQVVLQQKRVQTHVGEQVKKENLNDAEAALLLAQTLEFNGLPQLQSPSKIGLPSQEDSSFLPPLPNFLEDFLSPGSDFQTVNRLGEAAETTEEDNGLPRPGTLEHAVTLGLFKIQQGINRFARNPQSLLTEVGQLGYSLISGQPVADQKIGELPSTSLSSVNLNPTNLALGVLATGAIGSVMYSYITNSALSTNLATAIRRNDLVVAASDILGLEERVEPPDQLWAWDYYDDLDADYRYNGLYPPLPQYPDMDYRELIPYGRHHYQTQFSPSRHISSQEDTDPAIRPVYEPQSEESEEKMNSLETAPQPITVDMIEPRPSPPTPDLPYIVYSDETNPWDVVQGEVNTNTLYKRSGEV